MAVPKAISFDNYGTIIDWESGIQQYFDGFLRKKGIENVTPQGLQRRWEDIQFAYIQEQYRSYRQVLKDTLGMTCREFGFDFTTQDCEEYAETMGQWKPFPDAHDALLELKKYTKITLITNTDNDIIQESLKQIGVAFDDVVTAEMAGAYKPSHKGFLLSQQRLGLTQKDILHAGFGFKYDIIPATELGYETCWINRQGEARPMNVWESFMVGDIKTLAKLIKLRSLEG